MVRQVEKPTMAQSTIRDTFNLDDAGYSDSLVLNSNSRRPGNLQSQAVPWNFFRFSDHAPRNLTVYLDIYQ